MTVGVTNAQWLPDPIVSGDHVSKFKRLKENLYVLSNGNLYKSNDLGLTWDFIDGIPEYVEDFDVGDTNGMIVVLTGYLNVYISYNQGENWEYRGKLNSESSIQISKNNLYAYKYDLNKSDDLGETWQQVFSLAGTKGIVNDFATSGDTLFVGTGYNNSGYGLNQSNDNGINWERVNLPGSSDHILQIDTFDDVLYTETSFHSIYKSIDYGKTWTQVNELGPGITENYHLTSSGDTLVASTYDKLNISFDKGENWIPVSLPPFETWTPLSSVFIVPPHMFIGTSYGIFYTEDLGATWEKRSSGIYPSYFKYKKTNKNLYIVKAGRLYKKLADKLIPVTLPQNDEDGNIYMLDSLLLITQFDNSGNQGTQFNQYVSFNEGLTFETTDLPKDFYIYGYALHNNKYFVSGSGAIYKSLNATSWTKVNTQGDYNGGAIYLSSFKGKLWGVDNFNLISSPDEGETWSKINRSPIDTLLINQISTSQNYLFVSWRYEKKLSYNNYIFASGIYRFDGINWKLLTYSKSDTWPSFYVDNPFVAQLQEDHIYLSNNSGNSFKDFRVGIKSNKIDLSEIITFQDSLFLLLKGGGAWKRTIKNMNFSDLPVPYNLNGEIKEKSVVLTWDIDSQTPYSGFIIERYPSLNYEYNRVETEERQFIDADFKTYEYPTVTYQVSTYDNDGWSLPSEPYNINIEILGEGEKKPNNLSLYPNPVNNELFIESNDQDIRSILIYDSEGALLKSKQDLSNKTVKLDLLALPNQVLIIKIIFSGGSFDNRRVIHNN